MKTLQPDIDYIRMDICTAALCKGWTAGRATPCMFATAIDVIQIIECGQVDHRERERERERERDLHLFQPPRAD
jgi:hypothetical protein